MASCRAHPCRNLRQSMAPRGGCSPRLSRGPLRVQEETRDFERRDRGQARKMTRRARRPAAAQCGNKPDFVPAEAGGDHFSLDRRCRRPRSTRPAHARGPREPVARLGLLALARGGVFRAPSVAAGAVRSYRTFSPLPRTLAGRSAVRSLWHCPWPSAWPVAVRHHRCPVVSGLSSLRLAPEGGHLSTRALYDTTPLVGSGVVGIPAVCEAQALMPVTFTRM